MAREFEIAAFVDRPELLGARWWNHALRNRIYTRRALIGAGIAGVAGLFILPMLSKDPPTVRQSQSLQLQRDEGWNLDNTGSLVVSDATEFDVTGSTQWGNSLSTLSSELAPRGAAGLSDGYLPTLFQSLASADPHATSLRDSMRPMSNLDMIAAFARGRALADALRDAPDVSVILDLDGPISVAMAAGMSEAFEPIFHFDNWPHPDGCVRAQQTLAAVLFFRALFADPDRTPMPRGVLVLDRQRLTPPGSQFDNRYIARLPNVAPASGTRLLYVHDGSHPDAPESDDLNSTFVAMAREGTRIQALAITDLSSCPDAPPLDARPGVFLASDYRDPARYCFAGTPDANLAAVYRFGQNAAPTQAPTNVSAGWNYAPASRDTIFGPGPQAIAPHGFANVTTVSSDEDRGCSSGSSGGHGGSYSRGYYHVGG